MHKRGSFRPGVCPAWPRAKLQITGIRYQPSPRDFFRLPHGSAAASRLLPVIFQSSFASSPLPPPRRKRTISRRRAEKRPLFSLVVFHNAGRSASNFFKIASTKNGRIPKKAVDISGLLCYHATITNAMTQSSKQGDPLREVPVGARHGGSSCRTGCIAAASNWK